VLAGLLREINAGEVLLVVVRLDRLARSASLCSPSSSSWKRRGNISALFTIRSILRPHRACFRCKFSVLLLNYHER
jgi:DNA invertase Pin-like site-specific DNA recombinase